MSAEDPILPNSEVIKLRNIALRMQEQIHDLTHSYELYCNGKATKAEAEEAIFKALQSTPKWQIANGKLAMV